MLESRAKHCLFHLNLAGHLHVSHNSLFFFFYCCCLCPVSRHIKHRSAHNKTSGMKWWVKRNEGQREREGEENVEKSPIELIYLCERVAVDNELCRIAGRIPGVLTPVVPLC